MADVRVALQAIIALRVHLAPVNDKLHMAARASEGLQRMATATGDVIELFQIAFESIAQRRTALFPLLVRRNAPVRFVPDVFAPTLGLQQKQLYIYSIAVAWPES